jgi:hypothetical protein
MPDGHFCRGSTIQSPGLGCRGSHFASGTSWHFSLPVVELPHLSSRLSRVSRTMHFHRSPTAAGLHGSAIEPRRVRAHDWSVSHHVLAATRSVIVTWPSETPAACGGTGDQQSASHCLEASTIQRVETSVANVTSIFVLYKTLSFTIVYIISVVNRETPVKLQISPNPPNTRKCELVSSSCRGLSTVVSFPGLKCLVV